MRVVLILTVAAMMAAALLAWAEQPRERRDCATCPVLVEVPAGTFLRQDRLGGPTLVVRFERPYAIGKYAVTRAEFEAFVQATGYTARGCTLWRSFGRRQDLQADWRAPGLAQAPNAPVVWVSWHDEQAHVTWLAVQTGEPYRLLSAAEWEDAARAGAPAGSAYGLKVGLKPGDATCADCGDIGMMGHADVLSTKAVGTYDPNPFGIHEMLGNVAQWVADCATPSFAETLQNGSAWLAGDCNRRITRSGRWPSNWNERAGYREAIQADQRRNDTGFRVAKTPQ